MKGLITICITLSLVSTAWTKQCPQKLDMKNPIDKIVYTTLSGNHGLEDVPVTAGCVKLNQLKNWKNTPEYLSYLAEDLRYQFEDGAYCYLKDSFIRLEADLVETIETIVLENKNVFQLSKDLASIFRCSSR